MSDYNTNPVHFWAKRNYTYMMALTESFTVTERGIFMVLLDQYYFHRASGWDIPDNEQKLAKLARCTVNEFHKARPALLKYFDIVDGIWVKPEVDKEVKEAVEKILKNRKNGAEGGKKRIANLREAQ